MTLSMEENKIERRENLAFCQGIEIYFHSDYFILHFCRLLISLIKFSPCFSVVLLFRCLLLLVY
jgi:hypothetical protein